jgi:enoyl-CoA hydratase
MAKPQMAKGPVTVTRADGIAVVTFDRGDRLNALSIEAQQALKAAALELRDDIEVHAVVLTGNPVFSAGADLSDPAMTTRARAPLLEKRERLRLGPDLCAAWEALDQVTIAAVERFCIGGAMSLVSALDFRIAGRGSHFRLPEVPLAMNMSWQTQPRLVNLIGPARTKQLVIFGERLPATTAFDWGLVDELADDGGALEAAMAWARKVAALPPLSVRMAKRGITQIATALNLTATFMDHDQYLLATSTQDHREALKARRDKRAPKFTGE